MRAAREDRLGSAIALGAMTFVEWGARIGSPDMSGRSVGLIASLCARSRDLSR